MCTVEYMTKSIKKLSPEEKRFLYKGIEKLAHKIDVKRAEGVDFQNIVNDDSIKYDEYAHSFFAIKLHTSNVSLRVLYKVVNNNRRIIIQIHLVYVKKNEGAAYIKLFENYSKTH